MASETTTEKPKRRKGKSPTARTLEEAKSMGFLAQVVERWNPHARVRQDLFGVIDIIAVREGVGIIGIQATTGENHAARRTKAAAEPKLREWLAADGRFELWSWRKKGAAGKRKLWELRREELTLDDLTSAVDSAPPPTGAASAAGEREGAM